MINGTAVGFCLLFGLVSAPIEAQEPTAPAVEIGQFILKLNAPSGRERIAATRELFRRGRAILPELERAGARPMETMTPSRLDVIYTLIRGLEPGSYIRDSFGIQVEPQVAREDVVRMGRKYGFVLQRSDPFDVSTIPSGYVRLRPGKTLASVMKELLTEEPGVITVNLNYFVR